MAENELKTGAQPGWVYTPGGQTPEPVLNEIEQAAPTTDVKDESTKGLQWVAPESFFEAKSSGWYLRVVLATVFLAAVIYLLTRDKITTGVIAFCGLVLPFYAAKRPKQVNYQLDQYGFMVGDKNYAFSSFRCFAIVKRGNHISAVLTPLKRFMPYMYINFSNDLETKVTDTLDAMLPREAIHKDFIDRALKYIGL